jgi:flagellar biosynthetic protein FliO
VTLIALALAQTAEAPYSLDGGLLRAFFGLVFVLGLIGLLAYLLRRGVISLPGQRTPRSLSVETALSLGDRRSLVIVQVDGRRLLVGVAASQISLVAELGDAPRGFDQELTRAAGSTPVSPS